MAKKPVRLDENGHRRFGMRDCLAYAAGDLGCNMSFALKSTMAIFWTQFMGLDLWYSLLLIVVQVWDAINDPLIGSMVDADRRQYKRRNKFLQYIFVGSIGLIVGGACCFLPFPNAPVWAKMIIFIAGYVIWDAFYTVANVPYGSLLSLISSKPADRASLSAWRSVGSMVGNMLPMVILPFIIYDDANNLIGERVFIAALIMGVLGFVCFQFMIRNTEIREDVQIKLDDQPKFNVLKAMGNFVHNRPAVGATVAAMGMFIGMQGAATAITVLFQSYFKNIDASGIVQMFAMIPIVVFTPLARKCVVRFGKKELASVGALCSIVASILMFVLPITGDTKGMILYVVCQLINSLGMGIYSTVSWAMMGDAIDYNEWKTGKREEGTVYALHSFFRKLAQGIGPAIIIAIMVGLGYIGANEGNQTAEVALRMRYLVPATYLFSGIMQFVGLNLIYNLDKKTLAVMNEALKRDVEADDILTYTTAEDNDNLVN